jgi:hypothetical protein
MQRLSFYAWRIAIVQLPIGTNTIRATATDLAGLTATSAAVQFVVAQEAISREVSVFNLGLSLLTEAISREVSTFNFGSSDSSDSISREISTFNSGAGDLPDSLSREVSTFNFGPATPTDAVSREVSADTEGPVGAPLGARRAARK